MASARFLIFFILTNTGIFLNLCGQDISPSFRNYTTVDGLPSSEVYEMLQDRNGNIWFGTDRGVTRFNGYEFRTYTYKDGLTDNTVFKLFEDHKGRIWMQSFSGKIFYFENEKIHAFKENDFLAGIIQGRLPSGIFVDSLENVFLNIRDLGILKIKNDDTKEWRYKIEGFHNINYLIDEITVDNIFVSNIHAVIKPEKIGIYHTEKDKSDTISFMSDYGNRIAALRLNKNKLVFTVGSQIYLLENNACTFLTKLPGEVFTLTKDVRGNLIAGTSAGVYFFDSTNLKKYTRHYLEKNNVSCIMQDHEGGYWFTTLNNGVYYMPGFGIEGILFDDERFNKPISLTTDFRHSVYAGCWSGALVKIIDGEISKSYSLNNANLPQPITNLTSFPFEEKIYLSRSGPAWFADGKMYPYKTRIMLGTKTNFVRLPDGNLFCGGSAFIMKVKKDSIIQTQYITQRINCLGESPEHTLLVGCNRGVFEVEAGGESCRLYREDMKDVRVDDIETFGKHILFATKGKGVLVVNGKSVIQIDESNGLCSDLVNKILVSGDELWCISNKGISRIHVTDAEKFAYTIANIHSSEGLFVDEINDIAILNDTIYVATNPGVSFFNIHSDFINHHEPPVYITSLRVNNTDTVFSDGMNFRHDWNNLQIGFNGISYRSREKIMYRYELIVDEDTITSNTTNREVEFLTLRPGNYKFKVLAKNSSGVWSKSAASLSFTILPAWWQTKWFFVFMILFLTGILFLWYRNRISKIKINYEMKRRQASLQLTAMRAQMNPHFIFNVMNSIRNYMQDHDMKSAEKYLTSFSKLVRYTLDNSEVQEVTLEEELSALKNYTDLEMQRFENGFEFKIQCEEGIDLKETMLLSMVLQPFVENAIKHGISGMKSGGKILIDIRKKKDSILIGVEDNGVGMVETSECKETEEGKRRPHGASINLERIEAYNKVYNKHIETRIIHLKDTDGKPAGTRVELII
jgi:ligand-binding sensor domain-containing protein/anti-sigma regulatory factor (Ser/Thr protein kinase)